MIKVDFLLVSTVFHDKSIFYGTPIKVILSLSVRLANASLLVNDRLLVSFAFLARNVSRTQPVKPVKTFNSVANDDQKLGNK